jgi:hypothetical protein
VAEVDGRGKYLDGALGPTGEHAARAVIGEKVREDAIRDLGLEVVRWDLAEVLQWPQQLASRIERARTRGSWACFSGRVIY